MKSSIISALIILSIFPFLLKGQTVPSSNRNSFRFSISGKVTNATNDSAMAGASIYIPDLKTGVATDEGGNFTLKNIPTGDYIVQAGHVGFKTNLKTASLTKDITLNFTLEESITEEMEVVVTGSSKATSIRRNPIPIVSVNRQYLQQNLSTNIIDAISHVAGINAVTTGPNVSKPFIRGLGFNRILTLYDGVRQEGQQWGDEHGIEIDQNIVDRVEVVKGPASLIYGSDAIAGVVNLIPANPPTEGIIAGNIANEYQTNNGLISNSATLAGNKNSFTWRGTFSHKMATNYRNKIDGRVYGTGFRETDFSGLIGINRGWGFSHLGFSTYNNLQEIPDGSRDSATRRFTKQITEEDTIRPIVSDQELRSYTITPLHQRVQHYRVYSASSFIIGKARLALNLAYQKSIRQEFSHPQAPAVAGLFLQLNTFSYDAKYSFREKRGWSITGGINGMYQTNNVEKGTDFIIPSYRQFDAGPFVFVKKSTGKLEIAGGLRYDLRHFSNAALFTITDPVSGFPKAVSSMVAGAENPFYAYEHTFTGVSGSLGLSYRFSDRFSGKFNIGRGFRAPNISEISANGVHPGTSIFQLGNLDFKPEFNLQEDIGINYNTPHITVNAEFFNNNVTNFIFNQKLLNSLGEDSVIVPGTRTFQFQASKAHLYGAELSVDIHPHPLDWLHFENSLSLVYATNRGTNNQKNISDSARYLPFVPPVHAMSELRGNFKKVSNHLANAFVKVQLESYAAQRRAYLAYDTETPTPGYQLVNAGFGADVTNSKGKTILTFSIIANNLIDIAYQSHLNRLKYFEQYPGNPTGRNGIYNMGRNVSLKLNVPLSFSAK